MCEKFAALLEKTHKTPYQVSKDTGIGENVLSYSSKYPCHSGVDFHQYTSVGNCSGITSK